MSRYINEIHKYLIWHSKRKPYGKAFWLYTLYRKKVHPEFRWMNCTEILTLWRRHTVLLNTGTRNICLLQHLWHLGSDLVRITLWYNYRWLSRNSKRRSLLRLFEKQKKSFQKFIKSYNSKTLLYGVILAIYLAAAEKMALKN